MYFCGWTCFTVYNFVCLLIYHTWSFLQTQTLHNWSLWIYLGFLKMNYLLSWLHLTQEYRLGRKWIWMRQWFLCMCLVWMSHWKSATCSLLFFTWSVESQTALNVLNKIWSIYSYLENILKTIFVIFWD